MTPRAKAVALSTLIAVGVGASVYLSLPPLPLAALDNSHLFANVPSRWNFSRYLRRDLGGYLGDDENAAVLDRVTLLRDLPTQAGTALPKYYVWVRAAASDGEDLSGAARVAAVDRDHFEVVQYRTCADLSRRADGADATAVFPEALRPRISELAAANCRELPAP